MLTVFVRFCLFKGIKRWIPIFLDSRVLLSYIYSKIFSIHICHQISSRTTLNKSSFRKCTDIKLPQIKNIYGQGKITFE